MIFNFKITNGTSSEDKIRDIKVVGRKGGMNTGKIKGKYNIMLNQGYDGRDYQPYLTTTLPGSGQDSNTGDCGASP